jgi:hypothetical protein
MFPFEQNNPLLSYKNIEFSFAYAIPYVYSDLLNDLSWAKQHLLDKGGKIKKKTQLENQIYRNFQTNS